MEDDDHVEQAISLKEAARRLGLSYQTVWQRRHDIAFRLPGCRAWRVWPSQLAEIAKPVPRATPSSQQRQVRFLPPDGVHVPMPISAREATRQLDALLAKPPRKRRVAK